MTIRNITGSIFILAGISILAGNAVTYLSWNHYELVAVVAGLILLLIAPFLIKKEKRKRIG